MWGYILSSTFIVFQLWLFSGVQSGLQAQKAVILATVDVVNVVCTVRDRQGNYVSDLTKEDFQLVEDKKQQHIDFFYNESGDNAQPLTIVLLVDTSGSVREKLAFEQMASSEFLRRTLRTDKDMAAIVQFDSDINLVQNFTYDHDLLNDAILDMRAGGSTKLYDAIWIAVKDLLSQEVGRKIIVILSDGADTSSLISEQEAIRTAQKNDVVIYGIGIRSRGFTSNFGKLKRFAKSTGGVFFNSKANLEQLKKAFDRINLEIKNQYLLSYVSTNKKRNGSYRKIVVKAQNKSHKINHRKGYYSASTDH
jgi:Ca-activated chloride channel family protein